MNRNRLMTFGLAGAAVTALCCFTPILVGVLGIVGLGAVIGYRLSGPGIARPVPRKSDAHF